jgi:hypothetical protein
MAEYINIKGTNVETVASDPANPTVGQIWYNSSSSTLKGANVTTSGAWATGAPYPVDTSEAQGSGTPTAFWMAGGYRVPAPTGNWTAHYNYDGSAWTAGNSLNVFHTNAGGTGFQTAGLIVGSQVPTTNDTVEEYDGTNWATATVYPTPISSNQGLVGPQTAAMMIGGASPVVAPNMDVVNDYDGTTWTAETSLPSGRDRNGASGIQTAAIVVAGRTPSAPPYLNTVQTFDGSTWTTQTNYPSGRISVNTAGPSTNTLAFGGNIYPPSPNPSTAYIFDGSVWTAETAAPVNGYGAGCPVSTSDGGTASTAFFAGINPGTTTLDWTGPGSITTETITSS